MAAKRDYYEVLGVDRNADDAEIKRAFKRLAMKYHPDRNKEADAADKFREINEAYQVLSDPNKRSAYDAGGFDAVNGGYGGGSGFDPFGGAGDFADIFAEIFGGRASGQRGGQQKAGPVRERGRDIRVRVDLTLEEAVKGITKDIKIKALSTCPDCHGEGSKNPKDRKVCPECHGQGVTISTNGFFRVQQTCSRCHGEGFFFKNPCKKCNGSGRVSKERTVTIKIPGGLDTNQYITIAGEGEAGLRGGPSGDLLAVVQVKEHKLFKRDGCDLYCDVPISFSTAALGGKVTVPTIEGKLSVTIEPGTQTGTTYRLAGKGIQSPLTGRGKGNLYCTVVVETPINLTDYQKDLLHKLEQSLDGDEGVSSRNNDSKDEDSELKANNAHKPKSSGFFDDVKDFFKNLGKN